MLSLASEKRLRIVMAPLAVALVAAVGGGAIVGCRGEISADPPILPIRNMWRVARYNPQSTSDYFPDQRSMRLPVEGTMSREGYQDNAEIATGRTSEGYSLMIPSRMVDQLGGTAEMLARGGERFKIFCAPCHDLSGTGNGMVVKRGLQKPPSFHEDRLRHIPDGQLFATITNGVRNMAAYSAQIPIADRWAIVSYVRALQLTGISGEQK